jgi:hypothetical protein
MLFCCSDGLNGDLSEDKFGPHIPWREHSFLENPRLDPSVKEKGVVVVVCGKGNTTCLHHAKAGANGTAQTVLLANQLSDDIIR